LVNRPTPHYLELAPARSVRPGDPVFTVGFPMIGLLGPEPKFTDGSVSALSGLRGEASLVQITVPVQPGNSGGPLLNNLGQVVGIVTSSAAIPSFLEKAGTLPQNVNWAVKSEYARPLYESVPGEGPSGGRAVAIDRAMKATCMVEASR
jgi:S1-C subfamily serine protease